MEWFPFVAPCCLSPPPANPATPARASPPTSGVRPGNVQNIGTEWDECPIKSVNNS